MNSRNIYLVGTIPLTRPYDVFTLVADILGEKVLRVPDGEIGDRRMWVQAQYPYLLSAEAVEAGGMPEDGLSRKGSYQFPLRLCPGATAGDVQFPDLGYTRYARYAYSVFKALKEAERIPANWRLQIGLPAPMDVCVMVEFDDRSAIESAYERAMLREIEQIQREIPHAELAITFDVVRGVLHWEFPDHPYPQLHFDNAREGTLERYCRLGVAVASDVELGYHLCYGDQQHTHAIEPGDLAATTGLASALTSALQRSIDYFHVPVPRNRADDAYFEPLSDLAVGEAELYLGLVHYSDGLEGTRKRIDVAQKYRSEFGSACECVFGRRPAEHNIARLLQLHADAAS